MNFIFLTLCALNAVPTSKADKAFSKFSERYVGATLAMAPIAASYVGYRKYDGKWPDYSEAGVKKVLTTIATLSKEHKACKRETLSPAYQIDFDLIGDDIEAWRFNYTELKEFEWSPTIYNEAIGAGFYYLSYEPKTPAEWPKRLDDILARMRGLEGFLATAQARLKQAPKVHTEFAIGANPGNKDAFTAQLPALFAKYPKQNAEFEKLRPQVLAAIDAFQTHLEKVVLPNASVDWRLGEDKWTKKLRFSLASTQSPEQLWKDAESELERSRQRMFNLALPLYQTLYPNDQSYKQLIGDAKINTVVGRVINKAAEKHGTAQSLFHDVKRYADKVIAFIKQKDLLSMPPADDNFVIEPTPPFLDGMAVAFFNPSPSLEPWLKKSYWISSVPKDKAFADSFFREYNEYGLQTLTIHEAFPGHYVQLYWSQLSDLQRS